MIYILYYLEIFVLFIVVDIFAYKKDDDTSNEKIIQYPI